MESLIIYINIHAHLYAASAHISEGQAVQVCIGTKGKVL